MKPKADARWDGPSMIPELKTDVPGKLTIWRIENFKVPQIDQISMSIRLNSPQNRRCQLRTDFASFDLSHLFIQKVPYPAEKYGVFLSGDSFLVLFEPEYVGKSSYDLLLTLYLPMTQGASSLLVSAQLISLKPTHLRPLQSTHHSPRPHRSLLIPALFSTCG